MNLRKADLVLHPVRYQILQALLISNKTTQEIAESMPSTPKSSIYRHLKTLLDGGMVQVAETHSVRGIQEKVYQISEAPRFGSNDLKDFTAEDIKRMFAAYLSAHLKGFTEYIDSKEIMNLQEERFGFTDVTFYASPEELNELQHKLMEVLAPVLENPKESSRQRQMFSIITYQMNEEEK